VLLEAEQQPLPPARLRMKGGKRLDLRAHALPLRFRIDERAAIGVRRQHESLPRDHERVAVTRGNGDAALRIERDDGRAVEHSSHLSLSPDIETTTSTVDMFTTFFYVFPL